MLLFRGRLFVVVVVAQVGGRKRKIQLARPVSIVSLGVRGAGYPGNTVFDAEGRPHVLYFDPLNHRVREASADLTAL